ncbi:hypothetical protein BU17DRAFT_66060 [Hysterangium stoloniferum]|nr:hypothetical protein BU17DRAFT_66060 [Hysterangium stoloniferum]
MFAKSIVALGIFSILAVAAPSPQTSQCNTGTAQCCTTVGAATSASVVNALGLLAGLLSGITGVVGIGCLPIIGSVNCAQQPVCCTGNKFNGLGYGFGVPRRKLFKIRKPHACNVALGLDNKAYSGAASNKIVLDSTRKTGPGNARLPGSSCTGRTGLVDTGGHSHGEDQVCNG